MEQTVADILTCFSGVICAIRRHGFPSSTLIKFSVVLTWMENQKHNQKATHEGKTVACI